MTNFEFYKDEILKILTSDLYTFAIINNKIDKCLNFHSCEKCMFGKEKSCRVAKLKWLYEEHVEKPKLTKKERLFCELMEHGWIVRDVFDYLHYHSHKPIKKEMIHWCHDPKFMGITNKKCFILADLYGTNDLFTFIKNEDSKPWSIEDLLQLDVED